MFKNSKSGGGVAVVPLDNFDSNKFSIKSSELGERIDKADFIDTKSGEKLELRITEPDLDK